jgi:hypothetical protein
MKGAKTLIIIHVLLYDHNTMQQYIKKITYLPIKRLARFSDLISPIKGDTKCPKVNNTVNRIRVTVITLVKFISISSVGILKY